MNSSGDGTIQFYHGGRDWVGPFEVNPKNSKVMEHGPGLYLTNGIETARHYAKGGGIVQAIGIDPNAKRLSDVTCKVDDLIGFVSSNRVRAGKAVIADLDWCADGMASDHLGLEYLINLMINHKALTPSVAPKLNAFIVEQGADLDVFTAPMFASAGGKSDQWVVVFNPDVVVSRVRVDMKAYDWSETHLPTFEEQLAGLSHAQEDDPLAPGALASELSLQSQV
jgi:hypothetical protein